MPIDVAQFKGEAPRIAPRLLPPSMGQNSENARVISGNLESWGGFSNNQAGQVIVATPVTIWYMNDQLWLSWAQPTAPSIGGVVQKWLVAQGTPFYDIAAGPSPAPTDLFPFIYSMNATTIVTIDYHLVQSLFSYSNGTSPGNPPTGNALQYPTAVSNGTPGASSAATTAQQQYWASVYAEVSPGGTNFGYPGAGSTPSGWPYGSGSFSSSSCAIAMVLQPSGYIVVCEGGAVIGKPITGGVSAATSGSAAVLWVLSPTNNKAVYDIIPALSGSPGFIHGVLPCADGQHLVVLTGSANNAANAWHILTLTSSAATEIATGAWTSGPEQIGQATGLYSIPVGSSNYVSNSKGLGVTNTAVGMLESDLQHLWIVSNTQEFYVLTLQNGANYTTVFHGGSGGGSGPNPFWKPTLPAAEAGADTTIFADQGACAGTISNLMAYWQRLLPAAQEVDVAKETVSGDTSWRTIFCGFDVPRFTDLGLASGLTSGGNPVTGSSTIANNAGPYPIYYRKLGVSNPTLPAAASLVPLPPGSNAVTITETFDNPVQWNLSVPAQTSFGRFDNVGGNPGANLYLGSIGAEPEANKNFSLDPTQLVTEDIDFAWQRFSAGNGGSFEQKGMIIFDLAMDTGGNGSQFRIVIGPTGATLQFYNTLNFAGQNLLSSTFVPIASIPTWHVDADPNWSGPFVAQHWYHAKFTITPNATPSTATITYLITDPTGSVTIFTGSVANLPIAGSGYGFGTFVPPGQPVTWYSAIRFDNLVLKGTGPATNTQTLQTTTYLYTLVNDLGQESGPSPAMLNADGTNFITRPIGQGVQVTLPGTLVGSGADQTYFQVNPGTFIPSVQLNGTTPSPSMNLYRAVTTNQGTQFFLVAANIAFSGGASTTYTDTLPDSALSQVIQSLFTLNGQIGFWAPPPTNMVGILALPNGIYAGFFGNVLCLSVQNVPHAWPVIYQLAFDYDIVGIQNIDNTIVVGTKNYPYLCAGNTPDQFSQTKGNYPYACASKRSMKYLKGVGVVYATYEGLVAIAGPGQERLLTEGLFSKLEWGALNPASFIADINDGRYFCAYTPGVGNQGAFYIDVQDQGAGKVSLGWHFTARYNDPLTDTFNIVPDFVDPAIPIGQALQTIVAFEKLPATPLPYVWKSKQFYVPQPTVYRQARVKADSYVSLVLTLFADGVQYAQIPVTSAQEFAIPPPSVNGTSPGTINSYFEFQIASQDKINRAQFVENTDEWAMMQ